MVYSSLGFLSILTLNLFLRSHPQVDLFFYREPEEAKQQEEEEAVVATDYGITDYAAAGIGGLTADQWPAQISDWPTEAPSIPAVPAVGWSGEGG